MTPLLVPYFPAVTWNVGPVPLDPWAILVTIGFVIGLEVARARGLRRGLDVRNIVDGTVFTVGMGFVVGHLVHVLAYHPEQIDERGWIVLAEIWGGFSSMGGFLGAVIGAALFFKVIRKLDFWAHADVIMFAFPFAWIFGRLGCFSVHDHVGTPSTFLLAVDFPQPLGPRHDLGLYEALWAMVISGAFLFADKKPRRNGFFTALWCFMYAPVRFLLDFFRNVDLKSADVRWGGFTPAQWGTMLMFIGGAAVLMHLRKAETSPPADA